MNFYRRRAVLFQDSHRASSGFRAVQPDVMVLYRGRRSEAVTGVEESRTCGSSILVCGALLFEPLDRIAGVFHGGHAVREIQLTLPGLIVDVKIDQAWQHKLAVSLDDLCIFGI